ncbi:hypothetical protein CDD83_9774 [Cordyceps sp. RAO-2017]|nr:hypothetical protein CDD83_9774 [Cordyceps sp. RAO-2017]
MATHTALSPAPRRVGRSAACAGDGSRRSVVGRRVDACWTGGLRGPETGPCGCPGGIARPDDAKALSWGPQGAAVGSGEWLGPPGRRALRECRRLSPDGPTGRPHAKTGGTDKTVVRRSSGDGEAQESCWGRVRA